MYEEKRKTVYLLSIIFENFAIPFFCSFLALIIN